MKQNEWGGNRVGFVSHKIEKSYLTGKTLVMTQRISYYSIVILLILSSSVAKCQQDQWTADELRRANTAATAYYMTEQERDVLLYMNLARMYPQKYARVEVEPYNSSSSYKTSLLAELRNRRPVGPLNPDKNMFQYAQCWAAESGRLGLEGHNRVNCAQMQFCSAECCAYDGKGNGRNYVLILLIDNVVPSLGHRKNILNSEYDKAGASIQPHARYGYCCVIDYGCASKPSYNGQSKANFSNQQQVTKQKTTTTYTSPSKSKQQQYYTSSQPGFIDRFYSCNGRNYISLLSGGFGFNSDFICTIRLGTLGFRTHLFQANLLDFELLDKSTFVEGKDGWLTTWRPTAGACIPVGEYMSVRPYMGGAVNINNLSHIYEENDDYFFFHGSDEREYMLDHYMYGILGVSLGLGNFCDFYIEGRQWIGNESISLESEFNAFFLGFRVSLGFSR